MKLNLKENKDMELVKEIATDIQLIGGKTYLVGGIVRDAILGIENKDIDLEIHYITPNQLKNILSKYGEVETMGSSFAVLKLKGIDIDFAMPRIERKVGDKHCDFEVSVEPFIGTYNASIRRDITVGSIYYDIIDETIIDHFGGIEDIKMKLIKHVNEDTFIEDPLRVFRVCQFASRFNFDVDNETKKLCYNMDISEISKERILMELEKALKKSRKPSIFFKLLKEINKLTPFFNELSSLNEEEFNKLMCNIDLLKTKNIESFATLVGIYLNSETEYLSFINRFTNRSVLKTPVITIFKSILSLNKDKSNYNIRKVAYTVRKYENIFLNVIRVLDYDDEFFNLYSKLKREVKKPIVTSADLFNIGFKEGKEIGLALNNAMELQFKGENKDIILSKLK